LVMITCTKLSRLAFTKF